MPKTLIITGGSRGIGRAVALQAADEGWNVVFSYLGNKDAAEATVAAVKAKGGSALAVQADASSEGDTLRLFDQAEAQFGAISGLVINAGVVAPSMPLAQMPLDRIETIFRTNTLSAFLTAREGARRMGQAAPSSIVVLSSMAARLGSPNEYIDYAASKGALDTMVVGLAKELAPQAIRVNGVRPGLIETDIHASGGQPDRAARLGAATPLGRAGHPEEVAEAVCWLLSSKSSYATGTFIDVSGGR